MPATAAVGTSSSALSHFLTFSPKVSDMAVIFSLFLSLYFSLRGGRDLLAGDGSGRHKLQRARAVLPCRRDSHIHIRSYRERGTSKRRFIRWKVTFRSWGAGFKCAGGSLTELAAEGDEALGCRARAGASGGDGNLVHHHLPVRLPFRQTCGWEIFRLERNEGREGGRERERETEGASERERERARVSERERASERARESSTFSREGGALRVRDRLR